MRDIYICDSQSNLFREEGYYGLSFQVQMATHEYIAKKHRYEFQILSKVWQYHYGEEGDAFLSPNDVALLIEDIEYLKPLLKDIEPANIKAAETNIHEIRDFFDSLVDICQKAKSRNLSLKFIAD